MTKIKKWKNRFLFVLNHTEEVALVGMFALMVVIIFVQVIMRYVFNNSLSWSEELGKFLFIWITWVGISLGERRGEHIKITMLLAKLPLRGAQIANVLSKLTVLAICAITLYYGVILVITQMGTHYAAIKISVSWGYLAVVAGCALMIVRLLSSPWLSIGQPEGEAELEGEGGE